MNYILSVTLFCFAVFSAHAKETVTVYFYHSKPPLVIDAQTKQGLYYDLTQYLNSHSNSFTFEAVFVPRKRIERMLNERKLDGVLLGVNPVWFDDKNEQTYLWTNRIFTDRDEIVSLASTPVEYIYPKSLVGKVFGGVRGFYYFGINELVKNNELQRIDTVKEVNLFYMLLNQRIDSAVISRSTFDYIMKKNDWRSKFHISKNPHDIYDRRILVPKNYQALFNELDTIVKNLPYDQTWLSILAQYK